MDSTANVAKALLRPYKDVTRSSDKGDQIPE